MKAADFRLPSFGPHGTKLGHSWFQWIMNSYFSGWFDNSEKGDVSVLLRPCGVDPTVALHLGNTTDYRLPTFGPHGTKLGHSLFQWKYESDFSGRFDNSKKETRPGILSTCWGDPVVAFRLMNNADYRLSTFGPHGTKLEHSLFQWKIKRDFFGRFDNSKKETRPGILSTCWGDPVVAFRLMNNADYRLSTFGPHGTKLEHSLFQWKMKRDFFGRFDNSKKETLPGILSTCRGDPVVAFRLMNNADYLLSTFGPHGTKLENSWFQWKMKTEFSGRVDNSEKGDASVLFQHTLVIPCLHSAS